MENNEQMPHKLMVLIALIQGFCLLYLHQAIEIGYWPNNQPQWLFAFYSVALILPVMLLLSIKRDNVFAILKYALPFALLSSLLGYYVGSQIIPSNYISYIIYTLTIGLATFKALMYIQQIAAGERINYSNLFLWSWRNFLTLSLSLFFAWIFWLILNLWGILFEVIKVNFFKDLFYEPWFYYPAITLANGFGIIIFRRLSNIIDTIMRLQQALIKFLLILLVLVSILFLLALLFTGLAPLWESGGSALILWVQALMLFFVNAVHQADSQQRQYSVWLHRFIYFGIALLPIYSAISFYGLSLRVEQYGWSLVRCWAFSIWFLLALFSLGYFWGIVRKYDNWLTQLSRVNVTVGLVMLGMMIIVNSPLLDFRKIVVNDQLERLQNKEISIENFDIKYFRRILGKPGYEAIQEIKKQYASTHPEIVVRINALYSDGLSDRSSSTKEEFIATLTMLTDNAPSKLLEEIYKNEISKIRESKYTKKYYLQSLDLNEDSNTDYLLAIQRRNNISLILYYLEDGEWGNMKMLSKYGNIDEKSQDAFIKALKSREFKITRPIWNNLEIGGKEFQAGINVLDFQ